MSGRISLRTWPFPAAQALLTGGSTLLGVVLVLLWRPDRVRAVPFYSDASHHDPERVLLAAGENLACFLMPLVAVLEFLHQSRLAAAAAAAAPGDGPGATEPPAPPLAALPGRLRWLGRARLGTARIVRLNFAATLATTACFFVTANVPSKRPFTPPHQLAASGLILLYAVQAVLKAALAAAFDNYRSDGGGGGGGRGSWRRRAWDRHHMTLRMLLVYVLWAALAGTWATFAGRKLAARLELADASALRARLATAMALIVYAATAACVALMAVMAVDMRGDRVVLHSAPAADAAGAPAAKAGGYVPLAGADL